MSTLFIHAGPAKTGTTFLQQVVLPKVRSVRTLVTPTVKLGGKSIQFGNLFNFSPKVWADSGGGAFSSLIENKKVGENLVISDEYVCKGLAFPQPMIPGQAQELGPMGWMNGQTDTCSMAAHLQELSDIAADWGFSDVEVIATARRQDTRIASSYAQVSNRVLGASQKNFEKWAYYLTKSPIGYYKGGGMNLNYFEWAKNLDIRENKLHFIPFELLEESERDFVRMYLKSCGVRNDEINRILDILGAKEEKRNVSAISDSVWSLRPPIRTGPRLWPTRLWEAIGFPARMPLRWPDFSRGTKIFLTSKLSKEVLNVYKKDNQKLDALIPHSSLQEYGYY